MLEKVIENWTSRLGYIRASRGSHMPEIIFKIDEAHFWLNGYVNKQNCRIWSEANLQVYVETPLHPEKLTAWCALWAGGIIGPYFFKNDEGHNVTVNGDRNGWGCLQELLDSDHQEPTIDELIEVNGYARARLEELESRPSSIKTSNDGWELNRMSQFY
ncbi:uncharacterized protein TNCV_3435261 [Trichonephila clavipes]|nr:uncharacterized protein TNCV_3435261 [Trichonephila clavipes]